MSRQEPFIEPFRAITTTLGVGAGIPEGTLIQTPVGSVPVEALQKGQEVTTRDGPKPVVDIARMEGGSLAGTLFSIQAGALGAGMPEREIKLPPGQLVVVSHTAAAMYFGSDEVLAEVSELQRAGAIDFHPVTGRAPVLFRLLLPEPDAVLAHGLWLDAAGDGKMPKPRLAAWEARLMAGWIFDQRCRAAGKRRNRVAAAQ